MFVKSMHIIIIIIIVEICHLAHFHESGLEAFPLIHTPLLPNRVAMLPTYVVIFQR